jgi:UDPglucose 6-dehydrogenase
MSVNEDQKLHLLPKVREYFGGSLEGKKIALWGLAFKPNTDDIREAPALYNIDSLLKEGAKVAVYDPEATENIQRIYSDKIQYGHNQYEILDGADALMIMTEWPLFRTPDFKKVGSALKNKAIFDGRNLFEPEEMKETGFYYVSVGRNTVGADTKEPVTL